MDESPDAQLRLRAESLEWRAIEDEVVALDLRDAMYLGTNRTGAVLWEILAAGASRNELVVHMVERFDVDPVRAEAGVNAFLRALDSRDLLER